MIPHITRGDRAVGLMAYLAGAGRSNEHTDPHLVAGDSVALAWHDDNELSGESARSLARHLEQPMKAFGVSVSGGHVWHCSLSLRAEEGLLTDQQWQAIAQDFIAGMEFDDNQGTKAPCRWVAVRHGVSKRGNDHIHIAVSLVREDGTKALVHNDFRRAQRVARALEAKYGLEELESQRVGVATRAYHPAELDAQARRKARAVYGRSAESDRVGWAQLPAAKRDALIEEQRGSMQPRYALAVQVRACAVASRSEDEFVRRMRRDGLIVRPRFADGRTDVVTGFSVAARPEPGVRPIWYGGGSLARDLTLTRLRDGWEDSPEGASLAAAEWTAARRGQRPVTTGREALEPSAAQVQAHAARLSEVMRKLQDVPLEDHAAWATIARQTSGALAALSRSTEAAPGDLARAAHLLSRSAQTYERTPTPSKLDSIAVSGAAMLLASASRSGQGRVAEMALLKQMMRLAQAIADAAEASGQARHHSRLMGEARVQLMRARDRYRATIDSGLDVAQSSVGSAAPVAQSDPRLGPAIPGRLERSTKSSTQTPTNVGRD